MMDLMLSLIFLMLEEPLCTYLQMGDGVPTPLSWYMIISCYDLFIYVFNIG